MTINTKKIPARRGRPPKIARENHDTKAELIRSGLALLTEQGFSSSGIDAILKKVAVPKGSFYHYFDSKEAFGHEVIDSYATFFAQKLDTHLLNQHEKPLSRLMHFVEDAKQGITRYQFKRGCLVGNLGQEVTLLPESFQPQLIAVFEAWQQRVTRCLLEAKQQQQINDSADCVMLAEFFWIGWEGAISRARLVKSTQPLDIFFNHFMNTLPK